jgi:hypothetical protein
MGGSAVAINVLDDNVAKHGEEESRDGQHFRKGIGIASALLEGGSGVRQEMDQRRSQEDAACELRPQQQEGVIPPEEVRRDPTHESRNENNNQAINLHKNQPLGSQILRPYSRRRSIISNKPHRLLIRMSPTMRLNLLHRKQNTHKNHYPYHHFSPTHHLLLPPHHHHHQYHHPDKTHFQFLKKKNSKDQQQKQKHLLHKTIITLWTSFWIQFTSLNFTFTCFMERVHKKSRKQRHKSSSSSSPLVHWDLFFYWILLTRNLAVSSSLIPQEDQQQHHWIA